MKREFLIEMGMVDRAKIELSNVLGILRTTSGVGQMERGM